MMRKFSIYYIRKKGYDEEEKNIYKYLFYETQNKYRPTIFSGVLEANLGAAVWATAYLFFCVELTYLFVFSVVL